MEAYLVDLEGKYNLKFFLSQRGPVLDLITTMVLIAREMRAGLERRGTDSLRASDGLKAERP